MNKDERIKELEQKAYSFMTGEEIYDTLNAHTESDAQEYSKLMVWDE